MKRFRLFLISSLALLASFFCGLLSGFYVTHSAQSQTSQAGSLPSLEPSLMPEEGQDEVQASPAPVVQTPAQIVTQSVQTIPQTNQGGADVEGQDIPPANTQETQSASSQSEKSVESDQVATPEEPRRKRR